MLRLEKRELAKPVSPYLAGTHSYRHLRGEQKKVEYIRMLRNLNRRLSQHSVSIYISYNVPTVGHKIAVFSARGRGS